MVTNRQIKRSEKKMQHNNLVVFLFHVKSKMGMRIVCTIYKYIYFMNGSSNKRLQWEFKKNTISWKKTYTSQLVIICTFFLSFFPSPSLSPFVLCRRKKIKWQPKRCQVKWLKPVIVYTVENENPWPTAMTQHCLYSAANN